MSTPKKSGRGGLREPAGGRPPLPGKLRRVRCGFMTIPQWLADWLQAQDESAGRIVEQALIEKYGLEGPKQKDIDNDNGN